KPENRYATAAEFAEALKPFAGMAGKGYTAMMPKGTTDALNQAIQAAREAQAQETPAAAGDPASGQEPETLGKKPVADKTVRLAPNMVATTPEGHVPPSLKRRGRNETSPMVLLGIAAGCLVAGILIQSR